MQPREATTAPMWKTVLEAAERDGAASHPWETEAEEDRGVERILRLREASLALSREIASD